MLFVFTWNTTKFKKSEKREEICDKKELIEQKKGRKSESDNGFLWNWKRFFCVVIKEILGNYYFSKQLKFT